MNNSIRLWFHVNKSIIVTLSTFLLIGFLYFPLSMLTSNEKLVTGRERHEMLQEQHKVILKSHRCTVVVALAAIVSAVATCLLVYLTYQDLRNNNVVVPKVTVVESVQNPTEPHS